MLRNSESLSYRIVTHLRWIILAAALLVLLAPVALASGGQNHPRASRLAAHSADGYAAPLAAYARRSSRYSDRLTASRAGGVR